MERGLINDKQTFHLLGLGYSGHRELSELKKYKSIRSADSSAAFICSKYSKDIGSTGIYKKNKEKIDFTESVSPSLLRLLRKNIRVLDQAGQ